MKRFFLTVLVVCYFISLSAQTTPVKQDNKELATLFDNYYEQWLKFFPVNATFNGDYRYNNLLFPDFTDSYRAALKKFYQSYLDSLKQFSRTTLSQQDLLSYDIFWYNTQLNMEGLHYKTNRFPFNQMFALPLMMAQFGSGDVVQPFKTMNDYHNWIQRATAFSTWADSAIVYFRKGMSEDMVFPKALVVKMIPQMKAFLTTDTAKNVFYGPIRKFPAGFSDADKKQLAEAYTKLINEQIIPSYHKLATFLEKEYLPKTRSTSGLGDLPGGNQIYSFLIRQITTTNKTADEIFNTGHAEVKRIRAEMQSVKDQVGFKGTIDSLFNYMRTDPKFFPYKTPEEILQAYRDIQQKIDPNLKKLFRHVPKTPFVIKQIEAFRAASTAPQYFPGSLENNRPAIFYVPIVDVSKTPVDESVFIHEAIPGHHYQIALQRENESLPKFRRFGGNSAYMEGWGLYTESLGKELGCYTDPYQQMRALGWEIHRAIRLVTDAGMHSKGWTREQAIKYMMENEPITEQFAISEIERYMAIPAQALAYKVGELKIKELRKKYEGQLGKAFNIAAFHEELLKDGAMPLEILERKMDAWAKMQTVKKSL